MSGFVEVSGLSKKIRKAWVQVSKTFEKYIQTEDTDYVSGKVYYKLINNEYIPVDSNEEPWSSEYYENHPTRQYSLKRVNRAWVGDSNGVPKLVLDRPQNNWKLLLDSNDAFFTDDRGDQYVFTSAIMDGNNVRLFSGSGLKNKIYNPRTGMLSIDNSVKEQDYIHERYFSATGNNIATKDENDNIYVMSVGNQDSYIAKETKPTWTSRSYLQELVYGSSLVIYDNKIHILGSSINGYYNKHYSLAGSQWTEESTLSYDLYDGTAVVYNNKIHILGGGYSDELKHYSWDGTQWAEESTLPNDCYYCYTAVVYKDKIHLFSGFTKHYSWDGVQWKKESEVPYIFGGTTGSAVVCNNKIHLIGGFIDTYYRPTDFINTKNHYSWNGSQWTEESILPYDFYEGSTITYNNKIYILGSFVSDNRRKYYSWDGTQWSEESTLPYDFYHGGSVVYDNKIHILGGGDGFSPSYHYYFNFPEWTDLTTFPSEIKSDIFRTVRPSMFVKDNKLYFILETLRNSEYTSYNHCLVYYDLISGTWNTNLSINSPMTIEETNTHSGYSYFVHNDVIYITFGGIVNYFDETNRRWVGVPGFNVKTNMGTQDVRHTLCSYYDDEYYNISICALRDRIPKDIVKFRFTPDEPYIDHLTCDTSLVGDTRNQVRLSEDYSFLINDESGTKMYAVVQTLNKNNTRNLKIYEYNPEESEKFY